MAQIWIAKPEVYTAIHRLTLNPDLTCSFQTENDLFTGTYILNGGRLKLSYSQNESIYLRNIDFPVRIETSVIRIKETILFDNGYRVSRSTETCIFDESPCPSIDSKIVDNYPLTFYLLDPDYVNPEDPNVKEMHLFNRTSWKLSD